MGSVETIQAMRISLRVGEVMLQSSIAVSEVERAMRRMTGALGLVGCEISITLVTITMCAWDGGEPKTLVRVVELREPELDRLGAVDALSRRIADGRVTLAQAHEELHAITAAPSRYSKTVTTLATIASASAWIVFAGGGWGGALAGMLAPVIIARATRLWQGVGLTGAFSTALAAAVVVSVPHALLWAGVPMSIDAAVAGGLHPLLPGGALVAAVTDGILGSPISSVAKTLQAVMQALALAIGALGALALVVALGPGAATIAPSTSELVRILAAGVAIAGLTVARGVALPTTALASVLAMLAWIVPSLTAVRTWNRTLAVFAAAMVIGFGGQALAKMLRTTPSMFVSNAVYVLVPGMTIYSAMVAFAEGDATRGIEQVGAALRVSVAIASGIALGVTAARSVRFPRRTRLLWNGDEGGGR
jgi:uncharacterized membrane protein YjjP (DUF1212 family)